MTSPGSTSLYRQAILYLVGELTPQETAAFENQLAESQPVRDALVSAMEILASRWPILGPTTAWRAQLRRRLHGQTTARPWLSLAVAACVGAVTTLAVLAGLAQFRVPEHPPTGLELAETNPPAATLSADHARADVEESENLAAVNYVDLTSAERVVQLQQSTSDQKHANRPAHAPSLHLPLLEYLSRPCSHDREVGM